MVQRRILGLDTARLRGGESQAEEAGPGPAAPRYGAGDLRERTEALATEENTILQHDYLVGHAAPLPQEPRTGLERAVRCCRDRSTPTSFLGHPPQEPAGRRFEASEHPLLHPVGDRSNEDRAGDMGGRLGTVERAPPIQKLRLLIGAALLASDGRSDCTSWDQRSSAHSGATHKSERAVEARVSDYIGAMPFVWLAVDDPSGVDTCRPYIERNSIALLSNFEKLAIDPPSPHWLGRHCPRDRVQRSGLWNQNHVKEEYDPSFLDTLDRLVSRAHR